MKDLEIQSLPEFDDHKLVTFISDQKTNLRGFIAIHRNKTKGSSLGATRILEYASESDALKDALRLSKMMSYKSAMAGLKYGGAKAVLMKPKKGIKDRRAFFKAYAEKVNYLGGKFTTGTDIGVTKEDIKVMRKETPFVIGTKTDPAYYTAIGVCNAIEITASYAGVSPDLKELTLAIQGLGKVGSSLLKLLYKKVDSIVVSDPDKTKTQWAKKRFPKIKVVRPNEIYKQKVDGFIPCALGNVLNSKNVSQMRCKFIAGSANNQLAGEHIDGLLKKLGILYAPDYVANAGGLISVVDEMENKTPSKVRILNKTNKIRTRLKTIFSQSKKQDLPTNKIANRLAEKILNKVK